MVIRIAHCGDSHLDERNRLDDNVELHRAFLQQAQEAEVDLILHAGDFFERRSSIAERNALAEWLLTATEDVAPVVGVRGNHDAPGDLNIFGCLETRLHRGVAIFDRHGQTGQRRMVYLGGLPIDVIALPWFDKSHLVAALSADVPAVESDARTITAARQLLTLLRAEASAAAAAGAVPILLGHCLVAGSETSTGQTLIGQTVELAPGDLADVGAAYVALGHIHKHQAWGNVVYSGSPQRMNFGEPEAKGWVLVEIDPDRWREPGGVRWEFRELPARRIELIEVDWTDPKNTFEFRNGDFSGSLVRVRYRVRPEDLHLIDEKQVEYALRLAGAHSVKLEPILIHETRVRAAEIVSAATTFEKILAYWQAKRIVVPEAQAERVRAKLQEIEQAERAEVAA